MNKKVIILIIAGVIIILAVFFLFPKTGDNDLSIQEQADTSAFTMTSEAKPPTLDIPEGALPAGVTMDDIKIRKLTEEEIFGEGEINENIVAFALEPAGITFSEPVTFRYNVGRANPDSIQIPMLFHVTDDEIAVPENIRVDIDQETLAMTIAGDINSFSSIYVDLEDAFYLDGSPPNNSKFQVDDSFPVKIKIWQGQGGASPRSVTKAFFFEVAKDTKYTVNPKGTNALEVFGGDEILPEKMNVPKKTQPVEKDYDFSGTFICFKEGNSYIGETFDINYTVQIEPVSHYTVETGMVGSGKFKNIDTSATVTFGRHIECEEGASDEFILIGAQYTIICDSGTHLSGYYLRDQKTGDVIKDAMGNGLDLDTGKPVVCP